MEEPAGQTPFITTALHTAVIEGKLKEIERLLLKRSNNLGERDESHRTALHLACLHDHMDIVEWLLIAKTNRALKSSLDTNTVDIEGNSALHISVGALHLRTALLLLKDDASPFLPNRSKETPLLTLCSRAAEVEESDVETLMDIFTVILSKGVSLKQTDTNGESAHLLLLHSNLSFPILSSLLQILLQKDPSIIEMRDKKGKSGLEIIAANFPTDAVSLLSWILDQIHPPHAICKEVARALTEGSPMREKLEKYLVESPFVPLHDSTSSKDQEEEKKEDLSSHNSNTKQQNEENSEIKRKCPGLISRCRILESGLPPDNIEVKILSFMADSTLLVKLNTHMQVKQAIAKIQENEMLSRLQAKDIALYLPVARDTHSTISVDTEKGVESSAVWLDPELYLWHYGMSNGDLISLKTVDKQVHKYMWIRVLVRHGKEGMHQKIVRIERGISVAELNDFLHKIFMRLINQFMVLFLHDERHEGHWMDEEQKKIEYYHVKHMDIIELKEREVFKISFLDGTDPNTISCSAETPLSYLIKMIICSITFPVDDPTSVGIQCVKKEGKILSHPIWLESDQSFGSYQFHQSDELHCMSSFKSKTGSTIARLLVSADPNSSSLPCTTSCGEDVPLLIGEEIIGIQSGIRYLGVGQNAQEGSLFLTNAHLMFARQRRGYFDFSIRIPLGSIARVDKPVPTSSTSAQIFLDVFGKDMRTIRFAFLDGISAQRNQFYDTLYNAVFPDFYKIFAFYHKQASIRAAAAALPIFDISSEFDRMGVSPKLWRITTINSEYDYCASYPSRFIVPACLSDNAIASVFPFRSKGRISILSYYHHNTATITRCSQPKVGVTNARSEADELITNSIRLANLTNNNTLYLFDARPKANALANQAIGMGYEREGRYTNCKLEFLNIDNIHVMRDAYYKLQRLCETSHKDDRNFNTALDSTHWLSLLHLVINCCSKIAKIMDQEGCSVLLHCSDGWDRTAQLAALSQIFLNPFYRTIKGFQVLIEKDWLSVGHKFGIRCGHADPAYDNTQRSPIFLQFMDCVWQITEQFPCLFEFNEKYLLTILDNMYSCHYGNFLMNNERERVQANIHEITPSLWDAIEEDKEEYLNPFFLPGMGVIFPSSYYGDIKLWKGYYLRYSRTPNPYQGVTAELRGLQMKAVNESLQLQIIALKEQISSLQTTK